MLPTIKEVKREKLNFPQLWQAVIFRNYGLVKTENLAKTLACDRETVEKEAERLGLDGVSFEPRWEERGYITLIRNNWHLLPYEQILTLLNIDAERLDYILANDDFLSVKLGDFKPACAAVSYCALTDEEKAKRAENRLLSFDRDCMEDLDTLEELATMVKTMALCGLGKSAPLPVISTLKTFRDEYIEHIVDKKCRAKTCTALRKYVIDPNKCIGCSKCAKNCPVNAISGKIKQPFTIDPDVCIKCNACRENCAFGAIYVEA